jgi:hypothetical protein
VPIVIQGQTLILAIDDPLDMQTLDALHNMTGYRILPRVAPEIRIHYYLERFYGVPRPVRLAALGDGPHEALQITQEDLLAGARAVLHARTVMAQSILSRLGDTEN